VKFSKFINRLRSRFSILFNKILEKQLILKGVIAPEDWPSIKSFIRYDFMHDNHFEELKQAEVLQNRLQIVAEIDEYTGKYYSEKWVRTNVLQQSEDEMKEIDEQIKEEGEENGDDFEDEMDDNEADEQEPEQS